MSDVTNEEVREILNSIREKTGNNDIDDETVRKWSREDIDRLLAATRREDGVAESENEEEPVNDEITDENIYVAEDSFDGEPQEEKPQFSVYEEAEEETQPEEEIQPEKKGVDFSSIAADTKDKLFSFGEKLKNKASKMKKSFKSAPVDENRFELEDEADEFEEDFEEDEDEDIKIADFSVKQDDKAEEQTSEGKTVCMDKTTVVPAVEEEADTVSEESEPEEEQETVEDEEEQIIFDGYKETVEESHEKIEESEAERELFEKRKKKIDAFVLFGEENDPYGSESEREKIGEIFDTHDDRPRLIEKTKFEGLEYERTKDARRVRRYLMSQKKKSGRRVLLLCGLLVIAAITGIVSSMGTTVAGDRILTILVNILICAGAFAVSSQNLLESFELLKKKQFNINTIISASAVVCAIQTVLMFVLYFFDRNSVSVFGSTCVALLLLGELNIYVVNCRTADAMELCSGDNKDKLYSIESISDDKDVLELGKNVRAASPRIRYSCKTRFPSHLVEMCMSETSADKRSRLLMLVLGAMGLVNFIVAWAVSGRFAVGFAALTITLSMSVPAYGALLAQLPLRWVNKKINRTGAMISCQNSVNELYRTNAIVLDSRDLFDKNACSLEHFKDFQNVRMDDAMLYAAAMAVRSGGPLTGVFDRMMANRRDVLPTVKSFSYEERLGVSGWIYNQKVIFGNRMMMENHNVEVPSSVDEDKYLMQGHEIIYLAIAHKLAAMMVVDYAPNKKLAPYLKKLRDSGVSILVRNCDPNVTERMISECYDMRLDNIKIINSSAGRVFKKYKSRPKVVTRAVSIHDGSTYTFFKTLCTSAILHHTFKVTDILSYIGMGMGFAIVLVLSILNVVADLPAIFVILLQMVIAGAFAGITRISCGK